MTEEELLEARRKVVSSANYIARNYGATEAHSILSKIIRDLEFTLSTRASMIDTERFEKPPCYICSYNGPLYYQPNVHSCAAKYHAEKAKYLKVPEGALPSCHACGSTMIGSCLKCGATTSVQKVGTYQGMLPRVAPVQAPANKSKLLEILRDPYLFEGGYLEKAADRISTALNLKAESVQEEAGAKPRVFVDMDGVVVDFDSYKNALGLNSDEVKKIEGAYLSMKAFPEALDGIKALIGAGYDVWLATKPPTGIAHAYADKAAWVFENLPELKKKLIITHDKGLLGCASDFLIDDRPHKANCEKFRGTLIRFKDGMTWTKAVQQVKESIHAKPTAESEGRVEERSAQDYAIEHAGYLATAAESFMTALNEYAEHDTDANLDVRNACWRGLKDAIYQFRKRAALAAQSRHAKRVVIPGCAGDPCAGCGEPMDGAFQYLTVFEGRGYHVECVPKSGGNPDMMEERK